MTVSILFAMLSPILPIGQAAAFVATVILLGLAPKFDPYRSSRRIRALIIVLVLVPIEFAIVFGLAYPSRALQGGMFQLESLWVSLVITAALVFLVSPSALGAGNEGLANSHSRQVEAASGSAEESGVQPAWPVLSLSAALTLGWWVVVTQSTAGPVPAAFILPASVPLLAGLAASLYRVRALLARSVLLLGAIATTALFIVDAWGSPYVWNGWIQPPIVGGYAVVRDGALSGMVARESVADFYDRLATSIQKASDRVGGKGEGTLFEFGNYPIAYALSDLTVHRVTECPNHWIDLCPQNVMLGDLARFARTPSDVVVWVDIPEKDLSYQEKSFGLERSAYREWSLFRDEQVRQGTWEEVDRIDPGQGTPNRYLVSVYAVGHK